MVKDEVCFFRLHPLLFVLAIAFDKLKRRDRYLQSIPKSVVLLSPLSDLSGAAFSVFPAKQSHHQSDDSYLEGQVWQGRANIPTREQLS